jgi:hypothetical protein
MTPNRRICKAIAGLTIFGAMAIPGIAFAATSAAELNLDAYQNNPGRIRLQDTVGGPGYGAQNGSGAGSGAFGILTGQGYNHEGGRRFENRGGENSSVSGNNPRNGVTQETPRDHPAPQNAG